MEMSTVFLQESRKIADDFLQSIVFLDDKAFISTTNPSEDVNHDFDAQQISQVFAKENKICAVYRPTTTQDIENFKIVALKADVVVLDWKIIITENVTPETAEEDAADEPRGQYTTGIIADISKAENNALKLIIVYTGEDILEDITETVYNNLSDNDSFRCNSGECEINSSNIKILVRAKSNMNDKGEDPRFKQRPHLQNKILKYEDLPSFVLDEFTKMTVGLLPNFALLSLTTVRNNSHKILNLFSKELDSAYMGHKAILPIQNNSEELLVKLFGDTITDLLLYSEVHKSSEALLTNWLEKIIEENISIKNAQGKKINPSVTYKKDVELIKQILASEEKSVEKRFASLFKDLIADTKQREDYLKYLLKNSTALFEDDDNTRIDIDKRFAILTHHKSLFLPSNVVPTLTLGTIVKSTAKPDDYFVCIQQRCDSVRIKQDDDRKFLFLPLTTGKGQFHFITPDGVKLSLSKKSYSIKTIKFNCNNSSGEIKAFFDESDKKYKFKEKYDTGDTFEWIFDLKDLHSQRIVADYALQLSRVGLDESEWLRMAGN